MTGPAVTFDDVADGIDALRRGDFVVVVDDASADGEGSLAIAADRVTPEKMVFLVRHTSGAVSVALDGDRIDALGLTAGAPGPGGAGAGGSPATLSVDAARGARAATPAAQRATTVRALLDPGTRPDDLVHPGHVFPVRYREGGVLRRAGHAEAAVDLARLGGRAPAGVLSDIVDDEGTSLRLDGLRRFATAHDLVLVSVADVIRYRRQREQLVRHVSAARIPTPHGEFTAHVFASVLDDAEHVALVRGDVAGSVDVLVRLHSECLTGDVFGSMRCDCGTQLELALARIAREDRGVVVYLRGHEGRGIGLGHKLHAYALQDDGRDTVEANLELGFPADAREYGIGAQILVELGVRTMRLMSNNPEKFAGIDGYGLEVVGRVPLRTVPNRENLAYLRAKQRKLGHLLDVDTEGNGEGLASP